MASRNVYLEIFKGGRQVEGFYTICQRGVITILNFGSCMYRTWEFQTNKNNINIVIVLQWYTLDPSPWMLFQ